MVLSAECRMVKIIMTMMMMMTMEGGPDTGVRERGRYGGAKNLDPTCAMRDTVDFFQLDVMFFPHRAHIPGYLYLSICERSAR